MQQKRVVWTSPPRPWSHRLLERHIASPPCPTSLPSANPLTLVCISDTHCTEPDVPDGDVLLHAGDLTYYGKFAELQKQLDWLASLPHRYKVVIAGNHDLILDRSCDALDADTNHLEEKDKGVSAEELRSRLDWHDLIYLENSSVTLEFPGRSLRIYGSPRTPVHGKGAFQYARTEDVWANNVPDGTEVIVTHGPPRGYHDDTRHGSAGCPHLLHELWRVRPRLVVFGHIHSARGISGLVYDSATRTRDGARMGEPTGVVAAVRAVVASKLSRKRAPHTLVVNASSMGPGRPWYDPHDRYYVLKI